MSLQWFSFFEGAGGGGFKTNQAIEPSWLGNPRCWLVVVVETRSTRSVCCVVGSRQQLGVILSQPVSRALWSSMLLAILNALCALICLFTECYS